MTTTGGAVLRRDEVLEVIRTALGRVLERDPASITPATPLAGDPAVDSLVLVETVELVESRVRDAAPAFTIDDDEVEDLATVGHAVDYVLARLGAGG